MLELLSIMYIPNFLLKQRSLLLFILLFFSFTCTSLSAATTIVSKSFESGNLNGFTCSGNCPAVAGKIAKFSLTRNMETSYRTEVKLSDKKGHFDFGKEYWINLDYININYAVDSDSEVGPFQLHVRSSDWSKECSLGSASDTAPFHWRIMKGEALFMTYGNTPLWRGPIERKKWINIRVHFKISSGNDGFIELWKDGVKLGRVNGANSPTHDTCGKPMKTPYFKMGIYKYKWKTENTNVTRRELWIDNLKIIEGSDGSAAASASSPEVSAPAAPAPRSVTPAPAPAPRSVTPAPAPAPRSVAVIDKKLVAHWLMDSATGTSIVDRSGYGHAGKLVNGAKVIADEGVKFDGVNDYINVGKLDIIGNEVTVGAWFWSNNLSACKEKGCRIISKATGISEQDHYFMISTIRSGSKTRLRFRLKTNGRTSTLIATSGDISVDEWVHVTASYDGERMRLYKDGVEVGSKAKQGGITTNNDVPVWIGDNPPNAGARSWKGNIANVQVFNYAMTGSEVSDLASAEISSSPATNDVEAPKISNMNVDVTDTTAIITWDTDEASDSLVGYGLTRNYGDFNDKSDLFVTNHKVTLENLELGKSYHYRVRARDAEGNETSSEDFTFTVAGAATEDNLVAHWQGDTGTKTTVFDSSGNGFVGNLKNGATLLPNEGVKLDGIDDHMDLGKLDATGNAITVGAWFWSDDLANCQKNDCRIISKATGLGEQDHYFMVSTIKVGGKTRLRFRLKTNGDTSTLIADSGDIVKDEWFHVTASYDGAKMRLYKDGVEVGSMAKNGHITANRNASAWIGDNPPHSGTRPWKGNVGDVRVYNYPMTNSEVFELVR